VLSFAALLLLPQGYATPLTIAKKDVTLPEICAQIAKDSGIKVQLGEDLDNLKVTVFVNGMKARDLLDRIASLYDIDGTALSDRYRLKWDIQAQRAFESYVDDEYLLRGARMKAEMDALAKLTLKPLGDPSTSVVPKGADEAAKWAAERIGEPAYYAAGLWERAFATISAAACSNLRMWTDTVTGGPAIVFWVGEPAVPPAPGKVDGVPKNFVDSAGPQHGAQPPILGRLQHAAGQRRRSRSVVWSQARR